MPGTGRSGTSGRVVAVPPQPPDVAAEGLEQQREGDGQQEQRVDLDGGTPEAAMTSATPCEAVTVLRQSRRGRGARIH